MANLNLRNITNSFQDVRLVSLSSWKQANEIVPRDRGGPYIVLQEGYDPQDMKMRATEFILGRSGKWLALGHFYKMPVPERREEFVFGTVAEVMDMMNKLPSKAVLFGSTDRDEAESAAPADDEMAAALQRGKQAGAAKPT
jgi:hypothetical protein